MLASIYDEPSFEKPYPFHQLIKNQLHHYGIRPQTPDYQDVTLAIQDTLQPAADINPNNVVSKLRNEIKTSCLKGRCYDRRLIATGDRVAKAPGAGGKRLSDRSRAERKLAFYLVAPAAIVMIAVTAYPIIDTIILSLQRASLDRPAGTSSSVWTTTATCSRRTSAGWT